MARSGIPPTCAACGEYATKKNKFGQWVCYQHIPNNKRNVE